MNFQKWKHVLALGLALVIVVSIGVGNASNWLHAGEETEPVSETAPAEGDVQGGTEKVEVEVPPETTEPTKETEAPKETQPETQPSEPDKTPETTDPTQETTAPTEGPVQPGTEPTVPDETTETAPTETVPETIPETVPETVPETAPQEVLPAAQLPLTVTLVDEGDALLTQESWTAQVAFAEGETSAEVTLPEIEGYIAPELWVERTAETTELSAKAVYEKAPEETQPETTQPELSLEEQLDPNRSVEITYEIPQEGLFFGDTLQLKAEISGYDNVHYTLQWRWSADNENWTELENETGETLDVEVTPENYQYYWNVLVTVTGLKEAE